MKIKEIKMMPNPGGFGWGQYSQVRELGATETMPDDAVVATETDAITGWTQVTTLTAGTAIAIAGGTE